MADTVNGLNVAGGMKIAHPKYGILEVVASMRKRKPGGQIVNTVKAKNEAGTVGYLELTEAQTFRRAGSGRGKGAKLTADTLGTAPDPTLN